MTLLTAQHPNKSRLLPQLIKFGAVGGIGFIVNLVVFNVMLLLVLRDVHHATIYATVTATLVAIVANWVGNRFWAFADQRGKNVTREGIEFFVVSLAGMAIPLLCVWVSHYVMGLTSPLADNISANGVGLALGMLFRFALYRWWVFSPNRAQHARSDERSAEPVLAGSPDTSGITLP